MKKNMSLVAVVALCAQMMLPWVSYANETLPEETPPPVETETVAPQTETVPEEVVPEVPPTEETPFLDELLNPPMGFSMFSSIIEPVLPDLSGYQYFELASGSSCEVINSGMNVIPAITPDANTYGYYMNIYDRNTATSHNYLYYGGATKTNSYSCLVGTLNTSTNQCDIAQCLVGTEVGGSCYVCLQGTLNTGTVKCDIAASVYNARANCPATGIGGLACRTLNGGLYKGTTVGSTIYYCDKPNDVYDSAQSKCVKNASQANPTNLGGPTTTSTPAISTPVYTITPFNPNSAVLPNIVATNASGYDVKFFPLTLNTVLGVDLVLEAMIGFNPTPNSWNSVADLSIPTAVQTLLGTFSSTELTCGINAELPEQVQSCNLSQIPQLLTDITNALSSSAFSDMGQSVLSLGEVGIKITALLAGLQNGSVNPDDLTDIQQTLQGITLPDFTATADSFDALADAFEAASSCTALLGVDTNAVVAELRATAQALRDVDAAFETIKDSLETLSQPNQVPSAYIRALADLADAIADAVTALDDLSTSWDNLAGLIDTLSIPGIGNIGGLGDILGSVSDILDTIVNTIDDIVDPLHDASDLLKKLANLAEAIENNDTDAIIDALDDLGNTDFFNNAQAKTIATIAAIEDITNAIEQIYSLPLPQIADVSCDSLGVYQTEMISYLDNQIAGYAQLKITVQSFQSATNVNVTDITNAIDAIIAKLQHVKAKYASVNIGEECEDAQNAFEDARADLEETLIDAKNLLDDLKDEIKDRIAGIELTLDAAIDGIHDILEDALDSIPGLTDEVKERIISHLEAIKERIIDKLRSFTEATIIYFEENKLAAPTFGGLACEVQQITTEETATFALQDHSKPEEVLGYVAIVDGANGQEVYVLAGNEKADFVLPTPIKGEYNITFRTIGKDTLIHSTPFFNFVAGLDLTQSWTVLKSQLKAHIQSSVSQLPTHVKFVLGQMIDYLPQAHIEALLSALQNKTAHFTDILEYIQGLIDALNGSVGTWTKVTGSEDISVQDVINAFAGVDSLVSQYSLDTTLKGRFITSLFNPTSHYSALAVSEPVAGEQTVYAIAGEETTIVLGENNEELTYSIGEETVSPTFDDVYSENTDIEYTVTKYVGDCSYPLSSNGVVHVVVMHRPTVANIVITGSTATAFSRLFVGTNTTEDHMFYFEGTVGELSGSVYAGTLPNTGGTYTGSYRVCNFVEGFETPMCSDTASITLIVTSSTNFAGGGGGGGGGGGPTTPTVLLETGGPGTGSNTTGTIATGTDGGPISDKCSIQDSSYTNEENNAYLYGCNNDMTTIRFIKDARLNDTITRAELAKMISQFAVNILGRTPDTTKDCSAFAKSIANSDPDLQRYMVMSCQLDIMGIEPDKTPLVDFMPDKYVTRAEFGTVMSRLLRGDTYENNDVDGWFKGHLDALKANGIINNINPTTWELRAWILLILHRTSNTTQ